MRLPHLFAEAMAYQQAQLFSDALTEWQASSGAVRARKRRAAHKLVRDAIAERDAGRAALHRAAEARRAASGFVPVTLAAE